jgi:general stress protein YciG
MGMYVDEARGEREPVTRDALVRVAIGQVPDRNDPAVGDGDVGRERRAAASVEDAGPLEDRPEQEFNLAFAGYRADGGPIAQGDCFIMATNEEVTTSGGGMSVREAGKRGGDRVKAKYGSEFYEAIGRKGGEATKSKYGPSFYEEIGAKGGQKLKRTTKTAG